ncbi:MAG: DNA-3-methyladenine glycosylase 2 family protein, partial [Planctomycetaceae bacterium]|nr:DNA-3-methyladenine glycosylase 2 family protein [Planctomycetaceae bacterium]
MKRQQEIDNALRHLQEADPQLRTLISRVGAFTLRPNRDRFGMLVRSILSQQVSTKAAQSIRLRLEDMLSSESISPESISGKTIEELRSVGISGQKASYLHDLSAHVLDGRLTLNTIGRKSDEEIIEHLTAVKGIGEWTAHMFLIFALGRPDVFPHGDLGLRSALKILYDLEELPDKTTSLELAEPWRPYASVATWYCWRLHD